MAARPRTARPTQRGFTLVELMAVVVITGILSLMAMVGFRRHMQAARGSEALGVIQAIRSAQESYLAENHQYLNVSASNGGKSWYPQATPSRKQIDFRPSSHVSHPDYLGWRQLSAPVRQSVMFSYLVTAGPPGAVLPPLEVKALSGSGLSAPQAMDWYVIQAKGDVDGNGVFSQYASTSITGEIYVENETE